MDDLRDLYQELILDHSRHPRNYGDLPACNRQAKGHNPLCGDQLDIYLIVDNGIVKDVHFKGSGCAISMASASMMTDIIIGKTEEEAKRLFTEFHHMVTAEEPCSAAEQEHLDKLVALAGVKEFPARVKCATLAWHTLDAALTNKNKATTE